MFAEVDGKRRLIRTKVTKLAQIRSKPSWQGRCFHWSSDQFSVASDQFKGHLGNLAVGPLNW